MKYQLKTELTRREMTTVRRKIRRHYDVDRPVTEKEAMQEINALNRHGGDFDDFDRYLYASLVVGDNPIPAPPNTL